MAARNIAYSGREKRMSQEQSAAVAEPDVRERQTQKPRRKPPKRQPRYHVILWNDDDHTVEYVVEMMAELFAHPKIEGQRIANEVDKSGKSICCTTTMERAELKRDQIHAYGADKRMQRSKGSMSATIEPEPG
jgi:ATP-dependent Clp protease adaptor protein ClpS